MFKSKQFLNWISLCNNYNPIHYFDFVVANTVVGAIHKNNLPLFQAHPTIFNVENQVVKLDSRYNSPENRTQIIHQLVKNWYVWGKISGWREEIYNVTTEFNTLPLMKIERSAAPIFGMGRYGIHVNGLTYRNNRLHMWIAKRAKNKPSSPNKLDNLTAGGHVANKTVSETLIKECYEEANIPQPLAIQAQSAGFIRYILDRKQEVKRETLFIYDLFLPENFIPKNNDGEVAAFYLWPIKRVMDEGGNTQLFKTNINLVLIDFFVRYGFFTPDDENYMTVVKGLHGKPI